MQITEKTKTYSGLVFPFPFCLRDLKTVNPGFVWHAMVLGGQVSIVFLLCPYVASLSEITIRLSMAAGAPVITSAF